MKELTKHLLSVILPLLVLNSCFEHKNFNRELKAEFVDLYKKVENELGGIEFQIDTIETVKINEHLIYSLKIIGQGSPDWSISEKVMVTNNKNQVLYESKFRQIGIENITECGVDRISIKPLQIIEDGSLFFIDIFSNFHSCCGQHSVFEIERIVLRTENLDSLFHFEKYYENLQDGSCLESQKPYRKETNLINEADNYILETNHFIDGEFDKVSKKEIKK